MTIIKNLVFEGGGIKGLAYAGALEALAGRGHLQTVEQVAGTSAGAITALLVALGYDLEAINKELNRDFKGFTDGSLDIGWLFPKQILLSANSIFLRNR